MIRAKMRGVLSLSQAPRSISLYTKKPKRNYPLRLFLFSLSSANTCGKLDYKIGVVRLNLGLVCGLISDDCAAALALMNDDISALGIGLGLDRAQYAAAGVGSVAGIYVYV